jgi:ABC-2 type transport system permease protein
MREIGHSARLGWIDVQRMLRTHLDWGHGNSAVFGAVMYGVLLVGGTIGGAYLGFRLGGALPGVTGVEQFSPIEMARGLLAIFWLMFALIFAMRAVGQRGTLPQPEGVLTVVPTREALAGLLLAEYVYFLVWALLPAIGIATGLTLGAGVVWPILAVPLGVAGAGLLSVTIGYPLGLAIRHFASRFKIVAQHKTAIIGLVIVGYFVALTTGVWDDLMVQLFEPMQASPIGWFADLLLWGTPGVGAVTLNAVGAVALIVVVPTLGLLAGSRLAARHWFSDPVLAGVTESNRARSRDATTALEARLATILGRETAGLVTLSWRRARRSPLKLLYAFYPILLLVGLFADIVQTGQIPAYLPYAVLVFGAWAAGVVFTLNPLGDQGGALASTLLSRVRGPTFVRAHVLASLIVAVPLGTAATAVVTFLSPLDPAMAVVVVAATPVVMVLSAALSVGIGMAFPRFEATNVTRSMKTVLPSRWAFVLFTLHLFLVVGAGAVVADDGIRELSAGLLTWVLPFGLGVGEGALLTVSTVALVPLLVAPLLAFRYAERRFETYTLA